MIRRINWLRRGLATVSLLAVLGVLALSWDVVSRPDPGIRFGAIGLTLTCLAGTLWIVWGARLKFLSAARARRIVERLDSCERTELIEKFPEFSVLTRTVLWLLIPVPGPHDYRTLISLCSSSGVGADDIGATLMELCSKGILVGDNSRGYELSDTFYRLAAERYPFPNTPMEGIDYIPESGPLPT